MLYFLILIFFLCIPAFAADAAAVNPKRIYTLLANGLITFGIKGNPVFSTKALKRFETCVLVNNN